MSDLDEEMWKAVVTSDLNYDGIFFYAVKTTKIFCRPSCKSKVPVRENVYFFKTSLEAISNGFRPCKRCRPDRIDLPSNAMDDMIIAAQIKLETNYQSEITLASLASDIGISKYHFQRLFTKKTGCSPKIYLEKIRLSKAAEQLLTTTLNNTEICFATGFRSLSQFYNLFQKYYCCSPRQYRLKYHGKFTNYSKPD